MFRNRHRVTAPIREFYMIYYDNSVSCGGYLNVGNGARIHPEMPGNAGLSRSPAAKEALRHTGGATARRSRHPPAALWPRSSITLPPLQDGEQRDRREIQERLTAATRDCRKGRGSFEVPGRLTPGALEVHPAVFRRTKRIPDEQLQQPAGRSPLPTLHASGAPFSLQNKPGYRVFSPVFRGCGGSVPKTHYFPPDTEKR